MTHDEIERMPAGPEMDAMVAEKVMGCRGLFRHSDGTPLCECHGLRPVPRYSTSIAAAWEVVRKARSICIDRGRDYATYQCCFNGSISVADPAPLAICRAALKGVTK